MTAPAQLERKEYSIGAVLVRERWRLNGDITT
jgi:hypothetical protein